MDMKKLNAKGCNFEGFPGLNMCILFGLVSCFMIFVVTSAVTT